MLALEQWAEDGYQLTGCGCTTPSGSAEEWRALVAALRAKESYGARRLAAYRPLRADWWEICCPRNREGKDDLYLLFDNEAEAFCAMVEGALRDGTQIDGSGI